jgi:RNA polymerase sigma factor (sigma-70 family)
MSDIHAEYSGDDERKDYHLTITVKNNLLLSMMKSRGIETVAELSRQTGVSQNELGDYLRLLKSAYSERLGDFRFNVKRLCEFFNCLPDHIFPEEHLHTPLTTNSSSVEISMEELKSIPGISSPSPDVALIRAEVDDALYAALNNLNAKQKDILRMRFGLEGERYTLDEVAEKYGVSVERARQVEGKALRLLRESGYAKMLRDGLKQYEQ